MGPEPQVATLEETPNEIITNSTGQELTPEETEVLQLGLDHELIKAPRKADIVVAMETIWERLPKQGLTRKIRDQIKDCLKTLAYNICERIDQQQIEILNGLKGRFAFLKPIKGEGIVVLQKDKYIHSLELLFPSNKYKLLNSDPSLTKLNSVHSYLLTLKKCSEIDENEYNRLRPQAAHPGRAYGLAKSKENPEIILFVDTIGTAHYRIAMFLAQLIQPLATNQYSCKDLCDAENRMTKIPKEQGYKYMSLTVDSLFTSVPLRHTVELILKRIYVERVIRTTFNERTLKKLIIDVCKETPILVNGKIYQQLDGVMRGTILGHVLANIIMTEFEKVVVTQLIKEKTIKFYARFMDMIWILTKPSKLTKIKAKFNKFHQQIKFTGPFQDISELTMGNRTTINPSASAKKERQIEDKPQYNDTEIIMPYMGDQREQLVRQEMNWIEQLIGKKINFNVKYETVKMSDILSMKDKIPKETRSYIIYDFICPGCSVEYIGKTEGPIIRRLENHLKLRSDTISQHINVCDRFKDKAHSRPFLDVVFQNTKIIDGTYQNQKYGLFMKEALAIKLAMRQNRRLLNHGLRGGKKLQVFLDEELDQWIFPPPPPPRSTDYVI